MKATDADTLARLARELAVESDLTGALGRVVDAALNDVSGAEHAGITLLKRDSVDTPVYSSDLVRKVDEAQYRTSEGPCLDAAREQVRYIRVDDLRTDTRWPHFTPEALDLGIRAILSFQLYMRENGIGALNIYATTADPFSEDSLHAGTLLAALAAVGLAASRRELNLQTALESRDVVGQAKGILMERFKIDSQNAFNVLVAVSQHTHRKLRDVAEELAATGQLRGLE